MRDYSNPCSVLTKSPLLLRDLKLFRELAERTEFSASLSVPTLDERAWRETEPHTPHPRKRLEAVAELTRNGIPSSVLVAPLMPGINDDPRQVEEILELAGEAGARNVTGIGLHLRGEVRDVFFDWLRQYRPDLRRPLRGALRARRLPAAATSASGSPPSSAAARVRRPATRRGVTRAGSGTGTRRLGRGRALGNRASSNARAEPEPDDREGAERRERATAKAAG